jgi:hypothetical protein
MKPLAEMDEPDIDGLSRHARGSLSGYAAELKWTKEPGDIRAAMATVLGLLREAAALHSGKAPAIGNVIEVYGPVALDG